MQTNTVNMRSTAKKDVKALEALNSLGPLKLDAVLPHLSPRMYNNICECVHNCRYNPSIFTTQKQRNVTMRKTKKHAAILSKLSRRGTSSKYKQKMIKQAGGIPIAPILAAAVPLLISLISKK